MLVATSFHSVMSALLPGQTQAPESVKKSWLYLMSETGADNAHFVWVLKTSPFGSILKAEIEDFFAAKESEKECTERMKEFTAGWVEASQLAERLQNRSGIDQSGVEVVRKYAAGALDQLAKGLGNCRRAVVLLPPSYVKNVVAALSMQFLKDFAAPIRHLEAAFAHTLDKSLSQTLALSLVVVGTAGQVVDVAT